MGSTRARLARIGVALVLGAVGVVGFDAVTQVAGAAPPPVVTGDYAAYPPPNPAGCTAQAGAFLPGYRAWIDPTGIPPATIAVQPNAYADPGAGAPAAARSMRRFQALIVPGNTIVVRWTNWAAGCDSLPVSFPVKATNGPFFDLTDDQALIREPNGPFTFKYCYANGVGPDGCALPGGGFELRSTVPQLNIVCGYQIDVVMGSPLETVGPNGSYYALSNRLQAVAAGLGTFNTNPPSTLVDAANGAMPCQTGQRIVVDKQWVGTGSTPPANVPDGFTLTVTSTVSQTDLSIIGTATCQVTNGAFMCNYEDTGAPGVPQGGLLVNADSLLNVSETPFPGNSVDITFPVGMSSQFVTCQGLSGPCQLTITNTPPPPPPPPTTAPPPTTEPTTAPPPTPPTTTPTGEVVTIPNTLPPTGTSGAPLVLMGLLLLPLGAVLVVVTRRRATS